MTLAPDRFSSATTRHACRVEACRRVRVGRGQFGSALPLWRELVTLGDFVFALKHPPKYVPRCHLRRGGRSYVAQAFTAHLENPL
jgi:hypothetical protein